ncbi:MAG: hypothetical protein WBD27_19640 [Pyrinomonadaceae bacterium]
MRNPSLKSFFLYLLIASIAMSAMIGIGVILFGNFGKFETKVLLTTLTVTVTSILGLACGAYLETGRSRILPLSGIALAIISAVLWIILIWGGELRGKGFVKILMSVTVLAASCSHLSLLSLAQLERRFKWAYFAAHIVVSMLAAILVWLIWTIVDNPSDLTGRVIGVLSILVAAITILTPILHKLSAHETDESEIAVEIASLRMKIEELEAKKVEIGRNNTKSA